MAPTKPGPDGFHVLETDPPMAYIVTMPAGNDINFDLVPEWTDHPVIVARITTPVGEMILMAEPDQEGRALRLRSVHVDSDAGPNAFGIAALRQIAQVAMETMDYDEIIVEGAVRTTGANPGHKPPPFRFTRRARATSRG